MAKRPAPATPSIYPTDEDAKAIRRFRPGRKPNQALLDKALRKLALGTSSREIIRDLMGEDGVPMSTAYRYLRQAYAALAEQAGEDRPHLRNVTNMRLEKAMQLAVSRKDPRAFIMACAEHAKVNGLYAPTALDLTSGGDMRVEQMTSDEKRKALAALLARVAAIPPQPMGMVVVPANGAANGKNGH